MFFKSKDDIFCFFLFPLIMLVFFLNGCGRETAPPPVKPPVENNGEEAGEKTLIEEEEKGVKSVIVYFSDKQAACLVGEEREIKDTAEDSRIFALEALINGPLDPALVRTIPDDVKLLDFSVADGVATVNFSAELYLNHWGGSTGEILTVYSIVNTLSQFPEIEKVKIVINGEEIESLVGHMELDKPLEPDLGLVL